MLSRFVTRLFPSPSFSKPSSAEDNEGNVVDNKVENVRKKGIMRKWFSGDDNRFVEGEQTNPEECIQNPMLNEVVLRRMFDVCDLRDLWRFRLVCRQWQNLADLRWKNEVTVSLRLCPSDEPMTMSGWIPQQLNSLCESAFAGKPYKSYRMTRVTFLGESVPFNPYLSEEGEDVVETFFRCCGPSMKRLELVQCKVYSLKSFMNVVLLPNLEKLILTELKLQVSEPITGADAQSKVLPNLKSLSISEIEAEDVFQFKFGAMLLLSAFPNLQILRMGTLSDHVLKSLIAALERLKDRGSPHKITNLNLDNLANNAVRRIRQLLELPQFKLETLRISMPAWETPNAGELLQHALAIHGPTLKTFSVEKCFICHPNDNNSCFPFHTMTSPHESLTELVLTGNVCQNGNFHFLEQTPNLRVLKIVQKSEKEQVLSGTHVERMRNVVLPKLKVFHFDYQRCRWNLTDFGIALFVEMMPNLRELKAPLNPSAFQIVCEKWRELRVLELMSDTMNNKCFTGIVPWREDDEERLPNITDLKHLQVLKVNSRKLADDSVWNGFMQMPNSLNNVSVTLSHKTSNKGYKELYDRFPGGDVNRGYIPEWVPTHIRKKKLSLNAELDTKRRL